tara:strand:- start:500 stop:664 length:165 start_codon:yes stop_codon:yes gene_type:complete
MNNLILIKEKIQRAERLHKAQLLATKRGEFTPYRRSVFKDRIKQAQIDLVSQDS